MSAFFTLHRDLPREGPGTAADVLWALAQLDQSPKRVADLACGPGADLETMARALPDAKLLGIDRQAHFVQAAAARTAGFGTRVSVNIGDMAKPVGPFDLIWCAGAVYFMGIKTALETWRSSLSPGGAIAFSEPVLVKTPATDLARQFWGEAGCAVLHSDEIAAQVTAAGYLTQATRLVQGDAWAAYYAPMEARIAELRPNATAELRPNATAELTDVLNEATREIALWRAAQDQIAYVLSVVTPQ